MRARHFSTKHAIVNRFALMAGVLLLLPSAARGQYLSSTLPSTAAAPAQSNSAGAFALEAAAGALGSLAGMALVGLSGECGTDNLECLLRKIGGGGILGAIGATVGTSLAARATGSERSIPGAALGAVVGTVAGLGVHYLLNRNSDRNFDDPVYILPIFAVSQGVFAALGSRLLSAR